jgi:hypothetical protein
MEIDGESWSDVECAKGYTKFLCTARNGGVKESFIQFLDKKVDPCVAHICS